MPAQNCSEGLPLKFQGGTFGAIKIFWEKIFTGSSTGCRPEIQMYKCGYETSDPPWLHTCFLLNSWILSLAVIPT